MSGHVRLRNTKTGKLGAPISHKIAIQTVKRHKGLYEIDTPFQEVIKVPPVIKEVKKKDVGAVAEDKVKTTETPPTKPKVGSTKPKAKTKLKTKK